MHSSFSERALFAQVGQNSTGEVGHFSTGGNRKNPAPDGKDWFL